MIYLNNFLPVRLYYSAEFNAYRLEAPLADRHNLEYNEDFLNNKLPKSYKLQTTLFLLNPRIFPPVPLGASMFSVYQNNLHPYETSYIEWIAFPIMSNAYTQIGNFSFFAFTTCPSKDAFPIYILNEDIRTIITTDQKQINHYFLNTMYVNRVLDRDNFVLYVHDSPRLYWRGTTECLCVPSSNKSDFSTLVDCQRAMYHKVQNHASFTGNSGIPLATIRDKLYATPKQKGWWYAYVIFTVVCLSSVSDTTSKKSTDCCSTTNHPDNNCII